MEVPPPPGPPPGPPPPGRSAWPPPFHLAPAPAPVRAAAPPRLLVLGVIAFVFLVYLWNSWNRDFWAPEEPDLAAATKEMGAALRRGDPWALLFPTIGGEPYAEKPPLLYWLALASSLTGADPRTADRLPVALASALALAVTYLAARRSFDGRVALGAIAIQASSYLYFHCGSWYLTDALFAGGTSLAATSFAKTIFEPAEGSAGWAFAGWIGLTLAALAKSALLAPALVLGTILIYVLTKPGGRGIVRELLALRPLWGLATFLGLIGAWYFAAYLRGGSAFLRENVVEQHLLRLVDAESHRQPFWYYLLTCPGDFLPWSPFLPLIVFFAKAHFRRPAPRFFAIWCLWSFLLLSFISSKQGKYLLPMWPALSILLSAALLEGKPESIWEGFLGEGAMRGLTWVLRVPLAVAISAAIAFLLGLHRHMDLSTGSLEVLARTGTVWRWILLALLSGGALYAASIAMRRALRAGRSGRTVAWLALATLSTYLAFSFTYRDLNAVKSARGLCEEVAKVVGDRPLAIYGRNRGAVHYYLDRPVLHLQHLDPFRPGADAERALDAYLAQKEQVFLIIGEDDLRKLEEDFPKYRSRLLRVREGLRFGWRRRAVLATNLQG